MGTLAWVICQAFGVRCYYTYKSGYLYTPKRIVTFYGPSERPQVAAYHNKLQQEMGLQSGELREAKSCRGADDAASAGYHAGKAAQLNHGVNCAASNTPPLQIGG